MTEQQETTTPDQNTDLEAVDQADTLAVEDTEDTKPDEGREAAKYRRRLRETEKERDALLETVAALRRAAIDTEVAGKHRIPTEGFWATGITVDQLLDDDGNIDTEKIATAARDATDRLGVRRPLRNHVPNEGASPASRSTRDNWTDAFAPR